MKKRLFLLPLILASLVACGGNNQQNSNNNVGGDDITSGTTSQDTGVHDGLTAEKAFSPDELVQFMSNYQDKQVSTQEYYVKGVAGTSTYDSKFKSYEVLFQGHLEDSDTPVQIYSGVLDSSITGNYTSANAMAGSTVLVKGYLEKFGKKCEIPYLAAKYSPTGAATSPVILSISSDDQGQSGEQITNGADKLELNFTAANTFGDMPTNKSNIVKSNKTVTVSGLSFNYIAAALHPKDANNATSYLMLYSKEAKQGSMFGNKTATTKAISKVEIVLASSASTNAPFICEFGNSAFTSLTTKTKDDSGAKKATNAGDTLTFTSNGSATFFAINVVQGTSDKGAAWYYGAINKIIVTYVA